jgi:hypothetical protein
MEPLTGRNDLKESEYGEEEEEEEKKGGGKLRTLDEILSRN